MDYQARSRWHLWPLGGEKRVRTQIAGWCDIRSGHSVVSICSGAGTTEHAIRRAAPRATIVEVDPGGADDAMSRLPASRFDRVLIALALHGMSRSARLGVLQQARRICRPDGKTLVADLGWPRRRASSDVEREIREIGFEIVERHESFLGRIRGLLLRPARASTSRTVDEVLGCYRHLAHVEQEKQLLPLEEARRCLRDCRVGGLAVVGLEGYFVGPDGMLATTGMIRDYSRISAANWNEFRESTTSRAEDFLRQLEPRSGIMVHLVVWDRGNWR